MQYVSKAEPAVKIATTKYATEYWLDLSINLKSSWHLSANWKL